MITLKITFVQNAPSREARPSFMQCLEFECSNIVDEEFSMTLQLKNLNECGVHLDTNHTQFYKKVFAEAFVTSENVYDPKTYTNLTFDNGTATILKDSVSLTSVRPANGEQEVRYSTTLYSRYFLILQ